MNKKVLAAGIVMAGLLSGCASQSDQVTALQDQVSALSSSVETASSDAADAKLTAANAQAEAARANQRIDNISTSYKK